MADSLLDQLRDAEQLPSAPGVAVRIVELNRREDIDLDELSEALAQDPALVAKLLKTANSSLFGIPHEVTSVRQAVRILGLRSVNLLALSFSVLSVSSGDSPEAFNYKSYWTQTAVSALAGRMFALRFDARLVDEAFLAGLLADLGRMVLAECAADRYAPVLAEATGAGERLVDTERRLLDGNDHASLGGQLLREWGLPKRICDAISHHHAPENASEDVQPLARLVRLAALFAEVFSCDAPPKAVTALENAARDDFGVDRDTCTEMLTEVAEALPDVAGALQLNTVDPVALANIRVRATELLVRESLALTEQVHSVTTEMTKLAEQKSDLEERANTDALTGLRNRAFFDSALAEAHEGLSERSETVALMILDLDHFKLVNDNYGHQVGDEVLRQVGATLKKVCPDSVTPCRYGGEEFAVIAPGSSAEEATALAETIRGSIAALVFDTPKGSLQVTMSIGSCTCACTATPPTEILESADRALYAAKEAGRNRVHETTIA